MQHGHRDEGREQWLQRPDQGHHPGRQTARHGPPTGPHVETVHERPRGEMQGDAARPARPFDARPPGCGAEQHGHAHEPRSQEPERIGMRRHAPPHQEARGPDHDEKQRSDGMHAGSFLKGKQYPWNRGRAGAAIRRAQATTARVTSGAGPFHHARPRTSMRISSTTWPAASTSSTRWRPGQGSQAHCAPRPCTWPSIRQRRFPGAPLPAAANCRR